MGVIVLSGQSVLDIAIQTTGSAESALQIAIANGISVTDDLPVGAEVALVPVINKPAYDYYQNRRLFPATANKEELELDRIFGVELPQEFS